MRDADKAAAILLECLAAASSKQEEMGERRPSSQSMRALRGEVEQRKRLAEGCSDTADMPCGCELETGRNEGAQASSQSMRALRGELEQSMRDADKATAILLTCLAVTSWKQEEMRERRPSSQSMPALRREVEQRKRVAEGCSDTA